MSLAHTHLTHSTCTCYLQYTQYLYYAQYTQYTAKQNVHDEHASKGLKRWRSKKLSCPILSRRRRSSTAIGCTRNLRKKPATATTRKWRRPRRRTLFVRTKQSKHAQGKPRKPYENHRPIVGHRRKSWETVRNRRI